MKRLCYILMMMVVVGACDTIENLQPYKDKVFMKMYGGVQMDEGLDFLQTDDGGYVIVGRTNSFSEADYDVLLIKTDKNGNELWTKKVGDDKDNLGRSIIYSNDKNGFVICGETVSPDGSKDILVVKTDLEGNEVVSQTFGKAGNNEYGEEVVAAPTGGYFILGNVANKGKMYLLEVDESLQVKVSGSYERYSIGIEKSPFDEGKTAIPLEGSKYLCLGTTEDGEGGINNETKNLFLFTVDFTGSQLGGIRYYGTFDEEYASELVKVTGGYILVGYKINNNRKIPYLIKLRDDSFAKVWEKTYDDLEVLKGSNEPVSVIESNDGGYTILMNSTISQLGSQFAIMKLDVDGNKIWEKQLGSQYNDYPAKMIQLNDDYYVACGSFSLGESNGENLLKAALIKTNPKGELVPE